MYKRPYLHLRTFVLYLAKESGKQLVLGDSVLSIETLYKEKESRYGELSPIKWRLLMPARSNIVDMKGGMDRDKRFEILSKELRELIQHAIDNDKKVVLFGVRKGLAPSTVCGDCGTVLTCKNCFAPVVLHNAHSEEKRIYICHSCGDKRSATTTCQVCGSWNLVPLGIGVDRIEEEVNEYFPELQTLVLDRDHASTDKQAKKIVEKFNEENNSILISTELVLNLVDKVPYIGVVSLDSLFSIPDFSVNERIFYLITKLREMAQEELMIQTRNIGQAIITWAARGNVSDFYRNEIDERSLMTYPPFSIFIKVEYTGSKAEVSQKKSFLMEKFEKWQPEFMEKRGQEPRTIALAMILRIGRDEWPKASIVTTLSLLTPDFLIKVDPDTIL
jgi:primosomal protein N' (replication factor Y)